LQNSRQIGGIRKERVVAIKTAIIGLGFAAQALNWPISPTFLSSLPYLFTVLVLILPALRRRQVTGISTPAALGVPYFREDRN
jgi:ABC-type uncharacterized transport system permease subunit